MEHLEHENSFFIQGNPLEYNSSSDRKETLKNVTSDFIHNSQSSSKQLSVNDLDNAFKISLALNHNSPLKNTQQPFSNRVNHFSHSLANHSDPAKSCDPTASYFCPSSKVSNMSTPDSGIDCEKYTSSDLTTTPHALSSNLVYSSNHNNTQPSSLSSYQIATIAEERRSFIENHEPVSRYNSSHMANAHASEFHTNNGNNQILKDAVLSNAIEPQQVHPISYTTGHIDSNNHCADRPKSTVVYTRPLFHNPTESTARFMPSNKGFEKQYSPSLASTSSSVSNPETERSEESRHPSLEGSFSKGPRDVYRRDEFDKRSLDRENACYSDAGVSLTRPRSYKFYTKNRRSQDFENYDQCNLSESPYYPEACPMPRYKHWEDRKKNRIPKSNSFSCKGGSSRYSSNNLNSREQTESRFKSDVPRRMTNHSSSSSYKQQQYPHAKSGYKRSSFDLSSEVNAPVYYSDYEISRNTSSARRKANSKQAHFPFKHSGGKESLADSYDFADSYQDYCRQYYALHQANFSPDFLPKNLPSFNEISSKYSNQPGEMVDRRKLLSNPMKAYSMFMRWYYEALEEETPEPLLFSAPHIIGTFSPNGQFLISLPTDPKKGNQARIQIHSIQNFHDDIKDFASFPGPLNKNETHKDTIKSFCLEQSRASQSPFNHSVSSLYNSIESSSLPLIWEFLALSISQGGSVSGTDVAKLLLKNSNYNNTSNYSFKQQQQRNTDKFETNAVSSLCSGERSDDVVSLTPSTLNNNSQENLVDEVIVLQHCPSDKTLVRKESNEQIAYRIRKLLLFGRKKEALHYAINVGAWAHAMFISSEMDSRTQSHVKTRFLSSLDTSDPLLTFYQTMSLNPPTAITSLRNEFESEWCYHLSMILSNATSKSDFDRENIEILGDTLNARGYLSSAHFCYLMAKLPFGNYCNKSDKIVLISSRHSLPFNAFVSPEIIQLTEVYEYTRILAKKPPILSFQKYKFLYACWLVERGFILEALQYCEIIAETFMAGCFMKEECFGEKYEAHILFLQNQVYQLSLTLFSHDPILSSASVKPNQMPEWLLKFSRFLHSNKMKTKNVSPTIKESCKEECGVKSKNLFSSDVFPLSPLMQPVNSSLPSQTKVTSSSTPYQHFQSFQPCYKESPPTKQESEIRPDNAYLLSTKQIASSNIPLSSVPYNVINTASFPLIPTLPNFMDDSRSSIHSFNAAQPIEKSTPDNSSFLEDSTFSPFNSSYNSSEMMDKKSLTTDKDQCDLSLKDSLSSEGWFSGLFNRGKKGKNQMLLPDDSKKSIVYDEINKKWINLNPTEEDAPIPAPPPFLSRSHSNEPVSYPFSQFAISPTNRISLHTPPSSQINLDNSTPNILNNSHTSKAPIEPLNSATNFNSSPYSGPRYVNLLDTSDRKASPGVATAANPF